MTLTSHQIFRKKLWFVLSKPLQMLFHLAISINTLPVCWKKARICFIYKANFLNIMLNCRPVLLLIKFSKVFEIILHNEIYLSFKP